jgi:hypothetical protein
MVGLGMETLPSILLSVSLDLSVSNRSLLNKQVFVKCAECILGIADMDFHHPDVG